MKKSLSSLMLVAIALCVAVLPETTAAGAGAVEQTCEVYIGGFPVGIDLYSEGPIVSEVTDDLSPDGEVMVGDVIKSINGVAVHSRTDINSVLIGMPEASVRISLVRNNERLDLTIQPQTDAYTSRLKLGFHTKDGVSGLGTLTCVTDEGTFYSLGHPISDTDCTSRFECRDGYIYECGITGIKRPSGGKPGRLVGRYSGKRTAIGRVARNSDFGLIGEYLGDMPKTKVQVMPRGEVYPGKAQIVTTIGSSAQIYDIEIVKASRQNRPQEKGLVIKLTDEELLSKTSGILQGMSGSPILQNGKMVGAVTHVFTNDARRGYGAYMDWILSA